MSLAAGLLRKKREESGLTKAHLARCLKVSIQFVYNVEAGKTPCPKERAVQWCELVALDRSVFAKALTADFSVRIQEQLGVHEQRAAGVA